MSLVIPLAARWNCIAAGLFSPVAWQYENDGALEVRGLSISGRPKRSESNPRHSVLTESICSFQKWRSRKFSFSYFGSIMVITKLAESVYQAKKKEIKRMKKKKYPCAPTVEKGPPPLLLGRTPLKWAAGIAHTRML